MALLMSGALHRSEDAALRRGGCLKVPPWLIIELRYG
jgi:hypothetical protein